MTDIQEFCERFGACEKFRRWALDKCSDMAEVWEKTRPEWLVWVATRESVLDDCTLRLFACWSVRQVWHLLTDDRSRWAVETAERFARGEATKEELVAAEAAAWAATGAVAGVAEWAAARAAAWAAAARYAAGDAAWAVAGAVAGVAEWAAARAAGANYLRALPNPFTRG